MTFIFLSIWSIFWSGFSESLDVFCSLLSLNWKGNTWFCLHCFLSLGKKNSSLFSNLDHFVPLMCTHRQLGSFPQDNESDLECYLYLYNVAGLFFFLSAWMDRILSPYQVSILPDITFLSSKDHSQAFSVREWAVCSESKVFQNS